MGRSRERRASTWPAPAASRWRSPWRARRPARRAAQRRRGRGAEIRLPAAGAIAQRGPAGAPRGRASTRRSCASCSATAPDPHPLAPRCGRCGWVNDLRGSAEGTWWCDRTRSPATFEVARIVGPQVTAARRFATVEEAIGAAERPYRVPSCRRAGSAATSTSCSDVETLSLSDLDEVELWLRGELRPRYAARDGGHGDRRGLKTLASRMLAGRRGTTRSGRDVPSVRTAAPGGTMAQQTRRRRVRGRRALAPSHSLSSSRQ
jgi:hypothetical protein